MLLHTRGIVLRSVRYGDTSLVVKIFTEEEGLQSYMVKGARTGKGAIRSSHLQPLNLVEMVAQHRNREGLHLIKELRCDPVLVRLHENVVKTCIAGFMTELLGKVLLEGHVNRDLFGFAHSHIAWLEIFEGSLALFPHHFMLQLSRHLGFFPEGRYTDDSPGFDLVEGRFTASLPGKSVLEATLSQLLSQLKEGGLESMAMISSTAQQRRTLLSALEAFYALHLSDFAWLKTPEILSEVLG